MTTPIIFPDVELWATGVLRAALPTYGYPTAVDAEGRTRVSTKYAGGDSEVVVRRDGGGAIDQVREAPRLAINVYVNADTDKPVRDLALTCSAILRAAADGAPVLRVVQISGPSPIADVVTRRFMSFELNTRGANLTPTP